MDMGVFLGVMKILSNWIVVIMLQLGKFTKNTDLYTPKWVDFMLCKSHLNV